MSDSSNHRLNSRNTAFSIVLWYFAISIVWVSLSYDLLPQWSKTLSINVQLLQTVKGSFFVIISSCCLYVLINRYQKKLIKSEKQYKTLFYANPNPLWIYDAETLKFVRANKAAAANYGYNEEEFLQMSLSDVMPDLRSKDDIISRNDFQGNYQHIKKNGERLIASVKSSLINVDGREFILETVQDVTDKLKQEKLLHEAFKVEKTLRGELEKNISLMRRSMEEKQNLVEIIDRINNLVIITDCLGNVIWVNEAFSRFTGYRLHEIAGKSTEFLHGPKTDPHIEDKIMQSLARKEFAAFEVINYKKNGEEYWVELNISPIYNEKNEIERYISVHHDITERKVREARIQAYNEALGKLAWANSHEVRKPLANILSLVDLSKSLESAEEIREMHSLIEVSVTELDGKIKEMAEEIFKYEDSIRKDES